LNELSLFTGAGGGLLGSILLGWKTIGAVEIEKYPCKVLEARQRDGMLDPFPIWNMDIREFNERIAPEYKEMVDVITAGFPCQPFSVAGQRKAEQDKRNMWPHTIQCISIVRPRYAFLENVPGLLATSYIRRIYGDLAEAGYDARWCVRGADDVGAPHRRKRWWCVAYPTSKRLEGAKLFGEINQNGMHLNTQPCKFSWWKAEPSIKRVVDGVAPWMDRLKAIGNGQVPECMAKAFQILSGE
jgi:DNA (cytosine-5)-methyltransferase 1